MATARYSRREDMPILRPADMTGRSSRASGGIRQLTRPDLSIGSDATEPARSRRVRER